MDRRRVVLLLVTLLLMVSSKPVAAQDDAMVTEDVTFELTLRGDVPAGDTFYVSYGANLGAMATYQVFCGFLGPYSEPIGSPDTKPCRGDGTTYIVKTIVTRYEFAEVDFGIVRLYQQGGRVEQELIADSPFDTQKGPNFSFTYTYPDSGTDSEQDDVVPTATAAPHVPEEEPTATSQDMPREVPAVGGGGTVDRLDEVLLAVTVALLALLGTEWYVMVARRSLRE